MDILLNTKIDFFKYKVPAFVLSFLIIIGGFVSIWMKHGLRYGVDFSGGTALHLKFRKPQPLDMVRKTLTGSGFADAAVQGFTDASEVLVRIPQKSSSAEQLSETSVKILSQFNAAFRHKFGGSPREKRCSHSC